MRGPLIGCEARGEVQFSARCEETIDPHPSRWPGTRPCPMWCPDIGSEQDSAGGSGQQREATPVAGGSGRTGSPGICGLAGAVNPMAWGGFADRESVPPGITQRPFPRCG